MNPFLNLDPKDLLAVLQTLIDCGSVSTEEEQLCDFLEEWISQIRPDAKIVRSRNNLVVQIAQKQDCMPILFAGHLDTVPPSEFEGSSNQKSRIVGDKLYGLGSADMKSGLAIMIALLADIQTCSTFVFYECEEIAEQYSGLRHLVETDPDLLNASSAILLEPTDGQIEMGCQGSITVKAHFTGTKAHSARPWMGENAIHKAVKVLSKASSEATSQPRVEIEGLTYTPALQVTLISGGETANVVPDECTVTVNHRFAPTVEAEQAQNYVVNEICDGADAVEITSISSGAMPATDHPLVTFAKENHISLIPKIGWTDVARFYALGISAVNCGPGDPLLCHRADEHIEIEKLHSTLKFLNEYIKNI